MKTMTLIMFSIWLISIPLSGQTDLYKYHFKDLISDTTFSNSLSDNHCINKDFKIIQKNELFGDKKRIQNPDLGLKHFPPANLKTRRYPDLKIAEEYPGSSRFYAKRPYLNFYAYEKSFIIKPDTTVKYYLIIKDPFHQTSHQRFSK